MSENIPRQRRKYDKVKLPTPPPDPTETNDDFLAYLDGLQKQQPCTSASFAEDAFDHLEKLYKLMEQMLELREMNVKLCRRVRDLEFVQNLEKMRRELDVMQLEDSCPELDKDTAFAETILESILSDTRRPLAKPPKARKTRSGSMSTSALHPPEIVEGARRASACGFQGSKKRSKVSKWTKVKAAFRWEKASPTVSDSKSQDSGIGVEVARYLRVPSCDEGEGLFEETVSTASSADELHNRDDGRSSDDDHNYISHSKEGSQKSSKSHKTPWAKMKDIIHTRNSFKKKHRLSGHSDDIQIDVEGCSDNDDNVFEDSKEPVPKEVVERYRKMSEDDGSKWVKVKKAFLEGKDEGVEEEIQKNYKKLQQKLSLEFQEKLNEWERMKQNSPITPQEENKDPAFMKKMEEWQKIKHDKTRSIPMTSENNLPPEFKKKLQEWEKIRKESRKKKEDQQVSEDFRKKLEEWKQVKNSSPKLGQKDKKELQWFEKELTKIEKEKQRLECERQKYLEREEALSKLRNSVLGGLKKEVCIHTKSGLYKFEGISRKFTEKLYEWEKAQGIAPESSTFALLLDNNSSRNSLVRSKSADSVAVAPTLINQPSSLSLNDVEELENCVNLMSESSEFLAEEEQEISEFLEEPEALIVEIEDIFEETAAPLQTHVEKIQKPVYQKEEESLCEGECVAPKVQRSESAKAQNNYNLIEEIFSILKNLTENEMEIQQIQEMTVEDPQPNLIRLKMFDESQKAMSARLNDKVFRLQEANANVFANLTKKESDLTRQMVETLETIQDLALEIQQLTEKLDLELSERNIYEFQNESGACCLNPIIEIGKEIRSRMLDLRRRLSYICAASDLTAPRKKLSLKKKTDYPKSETNQNQGAIKKRIKHRQKSGNQVDSEDEEEAQNKHKKLTRTSGVEVDKSLIEKVVVPTQSNILNLSTEEEKTKILDSPVTLFVKTTRKLFTPIVESSMKEDKDEEKIVHLPPLPSPASLRKKDISPSIRMMLEKYNQKLEEKQNTTNSSGSASPVWRSPVTERRVKAQTERYQEELKKSSPLAASTRSQKLQKAKEEFLNSQPQPPKLRNRLSQISVDSSEASSDFSIMKSASAGMINVGAEVYQEIDPEVHGAGYVSLPRNVKQKGLLKGFSNIASKFRKVKMRKGKEKMNTVSALCRQSLIVDINKKEDEGRGAWVKKKLFK